MRQYIYRVFWHCLFLNLFGLCSTVERLIRSFMIVVVPVASQLPLRALLYPPAKPMKAFVPHGDGSKPFFDVVPNLVAGPTAHFATREGSQIATSID